MKNQIHVSSPGKLHLLGEHTAVYNKPALLASVAKRCHVSITPRKDNVIEIISRNLKIRELLDQKKIIKKTEDAQKKWEVFSKTNDIQLLKTITLNPIDFAIIALGEALMHFRISKTQGFTLTIESKVPIGSGMGSSASLAVSIAGALSIMKTNMLDKDAINTIAYAAEQKKHGFPSGGDNSACCYGGLTWYRRETTDFKIIQNVPFPISPEVTKNFFTSFTGTPEESTGEMVSIVRTLYVTQKKKVESILHDQEYLVRNLLTTLKQKDHDGIISTIRNGEKNLEKLGVVSDFVKKRIRLIEEAGGAAKICGGGGKTKGTGTLLVYHTNGTSLKNVLQSQHISLSPVTLGVRGIREELTDMERRNKMS